jgi:hypothetical protein
LTIKIYFLLLGAAFLAAGWLVSGLGLSPITSLSGQTLKAGHLAQPATMAIGHRVMVNPL